MSIIIYHDFSEGTSVISNETSDVIDETYLVTAAYTFTPTASDDGKTYFCRVTGPSIELAGLCSQAVTVEIRVIGECKLASIYM